MLPKNTIENAPHLGPRDPVGPGDLVSSPRCQSGVIGSELSARLKYLWSTRKEENLTYFFLVILHYLVNCIHISFPVTLSVTPQMK